MSLCDDSQLTATKFYEAITALWDYKGSLPSISTILSGVNNLKSIYVGSSSPYCRYLVQAFRPILTSILLTFVHSTGILLTFFYKQLYFGSLCFNDCLLSTGKCYSLSIESWQGVGFSEANSHFVSSFTVTDLSSQPEYIYEILSYDNQGELIGIDYQTLDTTDTLKFVCNFNLMNVDLKKFFDFVEGENTYNLIDALISVLKVSDNS